MGRVASGNTSASGDGVKIMNTQEMYEQAIENSSRKRGKIKKGHYYLHPSGITLRTVRTMVRRNPEYKVGDGHGNEIVLNVNKIRADVLSGKILDIRNFGKGMLKEVCEWLEQIDN